jgi:KUP system potassium uptake protein
MGLERFIMESYFAIDRFSLSEERAFGLDTSSVTVEKVPLVISPMRDFKLTRVYDKTFNYEPAPSEFMAE